MRTLKEHGIAITVVAWQLYRVAALGKSLIRCCADDCFVKITYHPEDAGSSFIRSVTEAAITGRSDKAWSFRGALVVNGKVFLCDYIYPVPRIFRRGRGAYLNSYTTWRSDPSSWLANLSI